MRVDGKGCQEISYEQVDVDMYIIFYKHCAAFHVSLGLYTYRWTSFSFFFAFKSYVFICFYLSPIVLFLIIVLSFISVKKNTKRMRYMDLQTRVGN